MPGRSTSQGATAKYVCTSLIIRPQDGVGSGTPSPR